MNNFHWFWGRNCGRSAGDISAMSHSPEPDQDLERDPNFVPSGSRNLVGENPIRTRSTRSTAPPIGAGAPVWEPRYGPSFPHSPRNGSHWEHLDGPPYPHSPRNGSPFDEDRPLTPRNGSPFDEDEYYEQFVTRPLSPTSPSNSQGIKSGPSGSNTSVNRTDGKRSHGQMQGSGQDKRKRQQPTPPTIAGLPFDVASVFLTKLLQLNRSFEFEASRLKAEINDMKKEIETLTTFKLNVTPLVDNFNTKTKALRDMMQGLRRDEPALFILANRDPLSVIYNSMQRDPTGDWMKNIVNQAETGSRQNHHLQHIGNAPELVACITASNELHEVVLPASLNQTKLHGMTVEAIHVQIQNLTVKFGIEVEELEAQEAKYVMAILDPRFIPSRMEQMNRIFPVVQDACSVCYSNDNIYVLNVCGHKYCKGCLIKGVNPDLPLDCSDKEFMALSASSVTGTMNICAICKAPVRATSRFWTKPY
jgi:hypothetical protein